MSKEQQDLVKKSLRNQQLLEILENPSELSWVSVAYLLENCLDQLSLTELINHIQQQFHELLLNSPRPTSDSLSENKTPSSLEEITDSTLHDPTAEIAPSHTGQQPAPSSGANRPSPSHVQELLNKKINTIQSKKSNIVNCFKNFLKMKTKQRVNCFGAALVSYLIAQVNQIPCQFYSSETHCWIEIPQNEQSLVIDVIDNLKAAKKSPLPLSIYYNKQCVDSFGLCMMLICNENPLTDDDILIILHHYRDRLRYSWEISKYFSLAHDLHPSHPLSDLVHPLPSIKLLEINPLSVEFSYQKASYYLNHLDIENMFTALSDLINLVTEICQSYSVNSELWFDEDCSLLALAEDLTEKFQESSNDLQIKEIDLESIQRRYEEWSEGVVTLCGRYLSAQQGEKLRRQMPMMTGKRRRIEKKWA